MTELSYSDKDSIYFLLQADATRRVYLTFRGRKRLCSKVPARTSSSDWLTKLAKELILEIRGIKREVDDKKDTVDVCFPDNHSFGD